MTFDPMGTTAIVTGASSGFGLEFAHRLAERGADLVLVARRADRLEALAAELGRRYGTTCTVVPLDLSRTDAATSLAAILAEKKITVSTLVNNAGFGTHGLVADSDPARLDAEVAVNVSAVVSLTRAFLPGMITAGNGALVNVASTAGFQPIPRMAVYGATKAFVLSFTQALWWEAKGTGVKVIALCPGPASTEFVDVAHNADAMVGKVETAAEVVAAAFRALDRRDPSPVAITRAANALNAKMEGFVPRRALVNMVARLGSPKK
ncbi:MAG: SDR family NAD(P)-dependent oxidoreductase [Actinomycetota bacterium]